MQCCAGFCHAKCKSDTIIQYTPPSLASSPPPFHPSKSSRSTRLDSLCYTTASRQLSISWMLCIYADATFCICPTLFFPLGPQVCFIFLVLHYFPVNISVNTFFPPQFHIYALRYNICLSFSDLFHSV